MCIIENVQHVKATKLRRLQIKYLIILILKVIHAIVYPYYFELQYVLSEMDISKVHFH